MDNHQRLSQIKRCWAIVKKNIRVYYSKGPVVIFGLMIPFFLFLSFYIGRNLPPEAMIPGLLGMTAFFTSAAVGPAIIPWEARAKTLERLISCPVSLWVILLGDMLSSFLFGALVSIFPTLLGILMGVKITNLLMLGIGIILGTLCFASFSILLSAYPPTNNPSSVMMLSSLIKFPLVFISGIFIPIQELPDVMKIISMVSPLTYFTDLARYCIQGTSYFPIEFGIGVLILMIIVFLTTAVSIHRKTLQKRL